MLELEESGNPAIATEHNIYDHRRLTTIYADHDLSEHGALGQPATLHRSSVGTSMETSTTD